jgi:preprotein translocase subunit SecG
MIKVLLVLHVFVTIALIGVVLIQRSEGGGLGLGGAQGMGSFLTGRGTANLLTRLTAILGTAFFALSLVLALLYKGSLGGGASAILAAPANTPVSIPGPAIPGTANSLPQTPADALPASTPAASQPAQPAQPASPVPAPAVPLPGKTN